MLFLVATTSLPAVDRSNADCWNAARLCQLKQQLSSAASEKCKRTDGETQDETVHKKWRGDHAVNSFDIEVVGGEYLPSDAETEIVELRAMM